MDIVIQDKKYETLLKNGKYQFTFVPKTATEKIKLLHMGCVGDTRLNHIQLEQGTEATFFVAPDKKVNSLSGIFKQLRDLDIQMRDQNSELWGKIKLNNAGAILDFYKENIKTEITTLAGKVNLAISELDNKVLKKSDVSITSNGITLGSGNTIDGRTIASIMKVQPDSIDLISPLIRVTGNMVVDGTLEGRKIKANTLETGHHKAGSITTELLAANAVKADKVLVDIALINKFLANSAFITELFAKRAFINQLQTVKITSTQIDTDTLYGKELNGVTITGTSRIKIGRYGFMKPIDKGLQINAPAAYGVNYGVGLQISGVKTPTSNGTVPKGLFIYNDPDFSSSDTIYENIDDVLLTVKGKVSLANNFSDGVTQGCPIISNFDYGNPVNSIYRISFIGWDGRFGQLYVHDGTGNNGTWWFKPDQSSSDKKLKENIQETTQSGLAVVEKLKFYSFDWKADKFGFKKKHTKIGQIAQEVQEIDDSLVYEQGDTLALDDFRLLNIALKAIQELSEENKQIKKEMEEFKNAE